MLQSASCAGKLSCFRPGISTVLPRIMASASAGGWLRHDHGVDGAALGRLHHITLSRKEVQPLPRSLRNNTNAAR
jgi:hypothetical protein